MSNLIGGVRFSLSYEGQKPTKWNDSHSVNSIQTVSASLSHDVELDTISNNPESMDIFGIDSPIESPSTSPELVSIFVILNSRLILSLRSIFQSIRSYTIRKRSETLFYLRFMF